MLLTPQAVPDKRLGEKGVRDSRNVNDSRWPVTGRSTTIVHDPHPHLVCVRAIRDRRDVSLRVEEGICDVEGPFPPLEEHLSNWRPALTWPATRTL